MELLNQAVLIIVFFVCLYGGGLIAAGVVLGILSKGAALVIEALGRVTREIITEVGGNIYAFVTEDEDVKPKEGDNSKARTENPMAN